MVIEVESSGGKGKLQNDIRLGEGVGQIHKCQSIFFISITTQVYNYPHLSPWLWICPPLLSSLPSKLSPHHSEWAFQTENKILLLPCLRASNVFPLLLGWKLKFWACLQGFWPRMCPNLPRLPHLTPSTSATQLCWPSGACLLSPNLRTFAHAPLSARILSVLAQLTKLSPSE